MRKIIDIEKFNTQIFSALDNILFPQINVQFDCWLSNLFCHFLDFTDYEYGFTLSAVFHADILAGFCHATISGTDDAASGEAQFLIAVGTPAHDARHGEERCVDFFGKSDEVINEAGIEIHVRAEFFAFAFDVIDRLNGKTFHSFHEFKLFGAPFLECKFASHLFEEHGTRIGERIDGVTDAIDESRAVGGFFPHDFVEIMADFSVVVPVTYLLFEMFHHVVHANVGSSVFWTFEGADAGGNGGIGVGAGGGSDSNGERGVVTAAVFCLKDEQEVKCAGIERSVGVAAQHVEEVLGEGVARLRVSDVERLAECFVAQHVVGVGNDGREL